MSESMVNDDVREHIHRYFVAVHGEDYVYRAPETFGNVVEQWMAYIAGGSLLMAEACIRRIEVRHHPAGLRRDHRRGGSESRGTVMTRETNTLRQELLPTINNLRSALTTKLAAHKAPTGK